MLFNAYCALIFFTSFIQVLALATPLNNGFSSLVQHSSSTDDTPSSSSIKVRITDTTGKDISQGISVYHHSSLFGIHPNKKRMQWATVPVPEGFRLENAYCKRSRSPQAYELHCVNMTTNSFAIFSRTCAANQACFQVWYRELNSRPNNIGQPLYNVYCMPLERFLFMGPNARIHDISSDNSSTSSGSIGEGQDGLISSTSVTSPGIGIPLRRIGSSHYAIEAILTGPNFHTSSNASSLKLQAQRLQNFHGKWNTQMLPGSSQCTDCSSLSVDPVPDGTQSFTLEVVMAVGTTVGTLLLGSILV
ncbi:hypothetical protein MMC14_009534 [Varicellaria rhodocarpa]|nr:hypothetical protein [Varicellaria rhodocarpa]